MFCSSLNCSSHHTLCLEQLKQATHVASKHETWRPTDTCAEQQILAAMSHATTTGTMYLIGMIDGC